jgi:hypothetical protein
MFKPVLKDMIEPFQPAGALLEGLVKTLLRGNPTGMRRCPPRLQGSVDA